MKIEKIYDEISQYEIENVEKKFELKGDLFIKTRSQILRHFLDRISYEIDDDFVWVYSPKLKKTFKIPHKIIKKVDLSLELAHNSVASPIYMFNFSPKAIEGYDEEYIWSDDKLTFYVEILNTK